MMDDDNNVSSLKRVRDGIAMYLGADDANPGLKFMYSQEISPDYAVDVTIESTLAIPTGPKA